LVDEDDHLTRGVRHNPALLLQPEIPNKFQTEGSVTSTVVDEGELE
jgi:hypothetical protein